MRRTVYLVYSGHCPQLLSRILEMADFDFTLFYFLSSYYSLKALYALYEKGVPFKEHIVFIHMGEQNEDWYRRENPNGVVPALKDGDKIIVESEEIINYIDRKCPSASPLVPNVNTKLGQVVSKYRTLLDSVRVDVISFGVMKNKSLCTSSMKFPISMQKQFSKENIDCASSDYWLCGRTFTAADVTATTLVLRFQLMGIDGRFYISNRPLCCEYRDRLMVRPAAKKIAEASDTAPNLFRNRVLKNVAKRVFKAGQVIGFIGADVYVYRKYFR